MIILLLAALLAAGPAEPAADAEHAARVAELVRMLDAAQLADRDQAERALQELGAGILPLLPASTDDTSPEATQRLNRLRQSLLRAQSAAIVEPTHVTLRGEKMPLAEVLAAISEQSGNRITDHRQAFGQTVTEWKLNVDFEKTPFWQALDQVLDAAELTLYGYADEPGLMVIRRPENEQPRDTRVMYAGAFRIQPVRFEATRDLRDPEAGALRLFLDVSWEPRLRPFTIVQSLENLTVTGDDDSKLPAVSRQASFETIVRRGFSSIELQIPLALPPRGVQSVRQLDGRFVALIPGPHEEFRFDVLPVARRGARPKAIRQRKGDTTLTLERVGLNNEIWESTLRIHFDAPSAAFESYRGWMFENQAFFVDAAGTRYPSGSVEQTRQTADELGLNYLFDLPDAGPDGMSFVYRTPLMIVELPVEYQLRDLPLP